MRQIRITKSITKRESPIFDRYLAEIGRSKNSHTNCEEEFAQNGDNKSRNKLVTTNLRFVVSVAKKYQGMLPLLDLISEGNLGMIEAAEKFDETRGFKFISYAVWSIRKRLLQAISEQARTVSLPLNRDQVTGRIKKSYQHLEQILGREPSVYEIQKDTGISKLDILEFFNNSFSSSTLEKEEGGLIEILVNENSPRPDHRLMKKSLLRDIDTCLGTLSEREKEVIKMSFGIGHERSLTFDEISNRLEISSECARQSKERALKKLRDNKKVLEMLSEYLN